MTMIPSRRGSSADAARLRAVNVRTAVILGAIALIFFIGIIVSHYVGGAAAGMAVLGIAVVLYLVVAIGRNVGSGK
ncbi:MAG TPA: hypothetical protein VGL25_17655 [Casimicrobiaceae bacterium]|jgi:hypothetical protein